MDVLFMSGHVSGKRVITEIYLRGAEFSLPHPFACIIHNTLMHVHIYTWTRNCWFNVDYSINFTLIIEIS